jgi:fatty-acyl-CoA synthase
LSGVRHFVALEGRVRAEGATAGQGLDPWLDYEALIAGAPSTFDAPAIGESDLLTINYTSGTTSRPKGVMITHRNAYMNIVGTLIHIPIRMADRYLWTLPMFHANGWTFVWSVTAAGAAHVCLQKVDFVKLFGLVETEGVTMLCAAPTVLIGVAHAPAEVRAGARRGVRVVTGGAPPAGATIERIEGDLGWPITHIYGLTETSPFITHCEPRPEHEALSAVERTVVKARQGVELLTSGDLRVVDEHDREVPHDGETVGEIVVRGNVVIRGTTTIPRRPLLRFAAATSTAATPRSFIRTATSTSAIG